MTKLPIHPQYYPYPRVRYTGRILPKAYNLTINSGQFYESTISDGGVRMAAYVNITNSIIDVNCYVSEYQEEKSVLILRQAIMITRALVNIVAFMRGDGMQVVLEEFIDPQGKKFTIAPRHIELLQRVTAYGPPDDLQPLLVLSLSEGGLAVALNDLIQTLSAPYMTPINCARAIEGIRHLFAEPGASRQQSWDRMREHLRLSREYLQLITDHSAAPRHGDVSGVSTPITQQILLRSWTVMDRYLHYALGNKQPLPLDRFPVLTE